MCAFYEERARKEKKNKMGGDNTRVPDILYIGLPIDRVSS